MKRRIVISSVLVLVLLFVTGCGNSGDSPGGGNKDGRLFGVSFQTMNNPFFVHLNEGLKEIVEGNGDRLVTLDAQWNSLKQKNDISDLVNQGAAAIFINPVNWEGVTASLLQAKAKGIPCIIVDAPAKDQDLVLCTVASDNVEAGRLAAKALIDALPEGGEMVILHHSINKACLDRVAGFHEVIGKKPEFKILDTQEGKGTTEGGRPIMRDLLGRFPDLKAVFAINDPSALGAISALESAGKLDQITVVSVDGSAEAAASIKAGKMLSTSAQFPLEIGKTAALKAYEFLAGKEVDKDIKIKVELVNTANVDQFTGK